MPSIQITPPEATARVAAPEARNPIAALLKRPSVVATTKHSSATPPPPRSVSAKLCLRTGVVATTMDAHPLYPYYLSAGNDGKISLWQFLVPNVLTTFSLGAPAAPVTRVRFSPTGMRFGAVDKAGNFALWGFTAADTSAAPFYRVQAHSKMASDFVFLNSGTFIATCGSSPTAAARRNVCLWDTLLPAQSALVASCSEIEAATSIAYSPQQQLVVVGDNQGAIHTLDVRKFGVMKTVREHSGEVNALVFDPRQDFLFSAGADNTVKCWSLPLALVHQWGGPGTGTERGKLPRSVSSVVFRDSGTSGITDIHVIEREGRLGVFTSGQDGRLLEIIANYAV